jgi:hypothetical protein
MFSTTQRVCLIIGASKVRTSLEAMAMFSFSFFRGLERPGFGSF